MRFRLFVQEEYQPLSVVPWWLWLMSILSLGGQLGFHYYVQEPPRADKRLFLLNKPPNDNFMQLAALGDPVFLGRFLMLNLQSFDNAQGQSASFRDLDYDSLSEWLDRIVALDRRSAYPHFSAAKLYASVADEQKSRQMLRWVQRHFADAPELRWEWMAYAANAAQYNLKDPELALELALELRDKTKPGEAPGWARQLPIFFLENKNEYEAAVAMLANLLEDGEVTDEHEFLFLIERLDGLVKDMIGRGEILNEKAFQEINQRILELRQKFAAQFGVTIEEFAGDEPKQTAE